MPSHAAQVTRTRKAFEIAVAPRVATSASKSRRSACTDETKEAERSTRAAGQRAPFRSPRCPAALESVVPEWRNEEKARVDRNRRRKMTASWQHWLSSFHTSSSGDGTEGQGQEACVQVTGVANALSGGRC